MSKRGDQEYREKLAKGVKALAIAALHHGPEAEIAFERILQIQEEYERRDKLLERAREIAGQD